MLHRLEAQPQGTPRAKEPSGTFPPPERTLVTFPTTSRKSRRIGRRATAAVAAGILATGLAACSPSEGTSDGATPTSSSSTFEGPQPAPTIKLVEKDRYELGGALVSVTQQEGINTKDTAFENDTMRRSVKKAVDFAAGNPRFNMEITVEGSPDIVILPIEVVPSKSNFHDFVVVKDKQAVGDIVGTPVAGATTIDPTTNRPLSVLAVLDENHPNNLGLPINANTLNINQQACNNMVEARLTDEGRETIKNVFPNMDHAGLEQIGLTMRELAQSSACGSFGLAAAAIEADLSYEDYAQAAATLRAGDIRGAGLRPKFVVLSRKAFNELQPTPQAA